MEKVYRVTYVGEPEPMVHGYYTMKEWKEELDDMNRDRYDDDTDMYETNDMFTFEEVKRK